MLAGVAVAAAVDRRSGWFGWPDSVLRFGLVPSSVKRLILAWNSEPEPREATLVLLLSSRSAALKRDALRYLTSLYPRSRRQEVARLATDPDRHVRFAVFEHLDGFGDRELMAVFSLGLADPEPRLARRYAEKTAALATESDLPRLAGFLIGRRGEWVVSDAEVLAGNAMAELAGLKDRYREQHIGTCGNPYVSAAGAILSRPWWLKALGPSDKDALEDLSLHYDLDLEDSDYSRSLDKPNRLVRERLLAWWRKKGRPPLVAAGAPVLRKDQKAFLREHPVQTTLLAVGSVRYDSEGGERRIPVAIGAGRRQALYPGATLSLRNYRSGTFVEVQEVAEDSSTGEVVQHRYMEPFEAQRLPWPGQVADSGFVYGDVWNAR